MRSKTPLRFALVLASTAVPSIAAAQSGPSGGDEAAAPAAPSVTVVQVPQAPAQGYPGYLPPPGWNPDGHLPSSSQSVTDTSRSSDGFDMVPRGGGPTSVHGGRDGQFFTEGGGYTPEAHSVRRGDTLWEISGHYYQNPYQWPKLWSFNPQIQNPHWIYPGDRVRLRDDRVAGSASRIGIFGRRGVPSGTVFLRDMGWVDDKNDDTWGDVVGSPSDHLMLSEGDDVYVQLGDQHEVALGDQLTLFRPIRTVESDNARGELVSIRGTARVERYNPKTKMVRARIIEAIDVIERGVKVGPVGRKFDVVPPVRSDRDLEASILASVYPSAFYGGQQVVFIDRGEKEGVRPGMRFFAIRRGDRWQQNIHGAGASAKLRPRVEDDRPARVDKYPLDTADEDKLPDETYAELRVMRVRDHTATALVVEAKHEIERTARLLARKGY